jgi:archaellum component FlaC
MNVEEVVISIIKHNPYKQYTIQELFNILEFNSQIYGFSLKPKCAVKIEKLLEGMAQNGEIFKIPHAYYDEENVVITNAYSYYPNLITDMDIDEFKKWRNFHDSCIVALLEGAEEHELEIQNIMSIMTKIENFTSLKNFSDVITNLQERIDKLGKSIKECNEKNLDDYAVLRILHEKNLQRFTSILDTLKKHDEQIASLKKMNQEKNLQIQELKEINEEKNRQITQLKDMHSAQKKIAQQQSEKIEELERKLEQMTMNIDERLSSLEENGKKKRFYFF